MSLFYTIYSKVFNKTQAEKQAYLQCSNKENNIRQDIILQLGGEITKPNARENAVSDLEKLRDVLPLFSNYTDSVKNILNKINLLDSDKKYKEYLLKELLPELPRELWRALPPELLDEDNLNLDYFATHDEQYEQEMSQNTQSLSPCRRP